MVETSIERWVRGLLQTDVERLGPLTADVFSAIVHRERLLVDRNSHEFALIVFDLTKLPDKDVAAERLSRALALRMRTTDAVGWLDSGHLGAMLMFTPRTGAIRLMEDVEASLGGSSSIPPYEVLMYPHDGDDPEEKTGQAQHEVNLGGGLQLEAHHRAAVTSLVRTPLPRWKRAMDIAGAAAGLCILSPLILVTAAAIKLTSPGPVFFSQVRAGLHGQPFRFHKFRSMVPDADSMKASLRSQSEQDGPAFKLRRDPRVTRVGAILRKTSIDELPQLWNVLRGDMSLVGPRPLPVDESNNCKVWQRRRLDLMPGITCIWQVTGRCKVTFDDWVRMDIRYGERFSPWEDLRILLLTIPAVVVGAGAH